MKKERYLSLAEREILYWMLSREETLRAISRVLGRNVSVVSRELKRNGPRNERERGLSWQNQAWQAHQREQGRRKRKRPRVRLRPAVVREYITDKIQSRVVQLSDGREQRLPGWSVKMICARMYEDIGYQVSHEAVYQWLLTDARHLLKELEILGKHRRRRKRTENAGRGRRPSAGKRSYSERPVSAESRMEFGHVERDAVVSARGGKAAVINHCERKTRYVLLGRVSDLTANSGRSATIRALHGLPMLTVTNDNGSENELWQPVEQVLGVKVYFCDSYTPQQRGTCERLNRNLRRIFPKGTNFDLVTEEQVQLAADWHNQRPMAVLRYKTPAEAWKQELQTLER